MPALKQQPHTTNAARRCIYNLSKQRATHACGAPNVRPMTAWTAQDMMFAKRRAGRACEHDARQHARTQAG
eukprot:13240660-Alexandrium_andersonii.AAC.1